MIASNARYARADNSVVNWTDENGWQCSALATVPDVVAFLAAGGTIAAYTATALTGCQIVSTGTPALNGTYSIDPGLLNKATSIAAYIVVNGKFPGGLASLAWPDASGNPHVFPTTASFQAFATALADYVTLTDLGQKPAQPSTIP